MMLIAVPPAVASPRAVSVGLNRSAVANRPLEMRIRAVDPAGPVTGLMATFGEGFGRDAKSLASGEGFGRDAKSLASDTESFGSSACLPRDSRGRLPRTGPFAPGAPSTLAAPHTYPNAGRYRVKLRVAGGGCDPGQTGNVVAPLRVTVVKPGQPPVAPRPETPFGLLPGGLVGPLPGVSPLSAPHAPLPGLIGAAAAFDGPVAGTARRR
jgi:hypothetical protein